MPVVTRKKYRTVGVQCALGSDDPEPSSTESSHESGDYDELMSDPEGDASDPWLRLVETLTGQGAGASLVLAAETPKKRPRSSLEDDDNPALGSYNKHQYDYYTNASKATKKKIRLVEKRVLKSNGRPAPLRFRLLQSGLSDEIKSLVMARSESVLNGVGNPSDRAKHEKWIESLLRIPFGKLKPLPVNASSSPEEARKFVQRTQKRLDDNIYGHSEAKQQIIRTLAKWISNPKSRGNVIGIEGPMGCGKTTLVKNCIAEALDLPLAVIPLGGLSDAHVLHGHGFTYEGSTHGMLAEALMKSKCMNPVILLDELDKIGESPRGQEVVNLLIHLTDGSQNEHFSDQYFNDIPIDFSKALIVFTYNDGSLVSPILKDRMTCIHTAGYSTADKEVIAEKHLLPRILQQYGYPPGSFTLQDDILRQIVSRIDKESGVRNLYRALDAIVSNVNLQRYLDEAARDETTVINSDLVEKYVPRIKVANPSVAHIYT